MSTSSDCTPVRWPPRRYCVAAWRGQLVDTKTGDLLFECSHRHYKRNLALQCGNKEWYRRVKAGKL